MVTDKQLKILTKYKMNTTSSRVNPCFIYVPRTEIGEATYSKHRWSTNQKNSKPTSQPRRVSIP